MSSDFKFLSGISAQCIDTLANWELINPIVPEGLLCIEKSGTDTVKLKIGDGFKPYTQLNYFPPDPTIAIASESLDGLLTKEDFVKLSEVEANANNYVHPITHSPSIIDQDANNRFVSDIEKLSWSSKQEALGFTPENTTNKNVSNGYAGLDVDGKIHENQLPSIAITDTFEAASEIEMLALSTAERGDVCVRTDINKTFILGNNDSTILSNWKELRTPTDAVLSVAGKTGAVTLVKGDVGLSDVDNTSDANKPVSTATQTALNTKVPTTRTVNGKALSADVTLTTIDVTDTTDKRYVTDAQQASLSNLSGANTGDETVTTLGAKINAATAKATPIDSDVLPIIDSAASFITKKLTWANLKATLKTYCDTLYATAAHVHSVFSGDLVNVNDAHQAKGSVSGAVAINLALGNVISFQPSGAVTLSFSGLPATKSRTFMLKITNGGAFAISFPGTITWAAGSPPALKTAGVDILICNTVNGGSNIHVAVW